MSYSITLLFDKKGKLQHRVVKRISTGHALCEKPDPNCFLSSFRLPMMQLNCWRLQDPIACALLAPLSYPPWESSNSPWARTPSFIFFLYSNIFPCKDKPPFPRTSWAIPVPGRIKYLIHLFYLYTYKWFFCFMYVYPLNTPLYYLKFRMHIICQMIQKLILLYIPSVLHTRQTSKFHKMRRFSINSVTPSFGIILMWLCISYWNFIKDKW